MKFIYINEVEMERLVGETPEAKALYLALRWRMDKLTGLVGKTRRLNLQGLREELYVDSRRGVPTVEVTKSKVRRLLDRLVSLGLLRPVGGEGSLIFELLCATRDKSVQNKPDTKPTHFPGAIPDTEADTRKRSGGAGFEVIPDTEADTEADTKKRAENAKADTHQNHSSVSKDTGPDGPSDPKSRMFKLWCALVGDTPANRKILGRMLKDYGDEAVFDAVVKTYTAGPVDPVPYLRRLLQPEKRGFVV